MRLKTTLERVAVILFIIALFGGIAYFMYVLHSDNEDLNGHTIWTPSFIMAPRAMVDSLSLVLSMWLVFNLWDILFHRWKLKRNFASQTEITNFNAKRNIWSIIISAVLLYFIFVAGNHYIDGNPLFSLYWATDTIWIIGKNLMLFSIAIWVKALEEWYKRRKERRKLKKQNNK